MLFLILKLPFVATNPYTIIKKISEKNLKQWKQWVAWVTLSDGLAELWALIPRQWQEACSGGRGPHRKGSAHFPSERRYNGYLFLFFFVFEGIKWKQRVRARNTNTTNQYKETQQDPKTNSCCLLSSLIWISLYYIVEFVIFWCYPANNTTSLHWIICQWEVGQT